MNNNFARKNSNYIIPKYNIDIFLDVKLRTRAEWSESNPVNDSYNIIFTNVIETPIKYSFPLPTESSIFQCEIHSILKACEKMITLETAGCNIAICVDRQL